MRLPVSGENDWSGSRSQSHGNLRAVRARAAAVPSSGRSASRPRGSSPGLSGRTEAGPAAPFGDVISYGPRRVPAVRLMGTSGRWTGRNDRRIVPPGTRRIAVPQRTGSQMTAAIAVAAGRRACARQAKAVFCPSEAKVVLQKHACFCAFQAKVGRISGSYETLSGTLRGAAGLTVRSPPPHAPSTRSRSPPTPCRALRWRRATRERGAIGDANTQRPRCGCSTRRGRRTAVLSGL